MTYSFCLEVQLADTFLHSEATGFVPCRSLLAKISYKLTLQVCVATIVARIIIVHIADSEYSCRVSINQLMQIELTWVCC